MIPRWLAWLFVLFLGYVIFTGNRGITASETPQERVAREAQVAQQYPSIHALSDGERWKKAINPAYAGAQDACAPTTLGEGRIGSYAVLEKEGTGDAVQCGEPLRFSAVLWDAQGRKTKEFGDVHLTLGQQAGLDALLVGMAVGEQRLLVLPVPKSGFLPLPELARDRVALLSVTRLAEVAPAPETTP